MKGAYKVRLFDQTRMRQDGDAVPEPLVVLAQHRRERDDLARRRVRELRPLGLPSEARHDRERAEDDGLSGWLAEEESEGFEDPWVPVRL